VSHTIILLLAGGLACLIGLVLVGLMLLHGNERDRAWALRREQTIGPYLKPKATPGPQIMLAMRDTSKKGNLLSQIPELFGWNEERRSQYPMSWWLLAIVMLGPSVIIALLATKLAGSFGWILVPFADILLTRTVLGYVANKISTQLLSQFPDALSMIARSVRVGVPVTEAVRVVAREGLSPTREEFARAADAMAIGVDVERALTEMAQRNQLAEYRFFATALALQSQTGGGLTETLDTLADTIRKRDAARKRGNALASEAKTSIYVLSALPIVTAVMMWLSAPDYISILFTTSGGTKLLAAAVFSLGMGWFAMSQIIKRSLS
jgi:tight adherence protein B